MVSIASLLRSKPPASSPTPEAFFFGCLRAPLGSYQVSRLKLSPMYLGFLFTVPSAFLWFPGQFNQVSAHYRPRTHHQTAPSQVHI